MVDNKYPAKDLVARVAELERKGRRERAALRGAALLLGPMLALACLVWTGPRPAWAGPLGLHIFTRDTPAKASEVNENFATLENEVLEKVDKGGDTMSGSLTVTGNVGATGSLSAGGNAVVSGRVESSNVQRYQGTMPAAGPWYDLFSAQAGKNYLILGTLGFTDCTTGSVVAHLDYYWTGSTGAHRLTVLDGEASRIQYSGGQVQISFRRNDVDYGRSYNFTVITQP
jgi:hypothetical protein